MPIRENSNELEVNSRFVPITDSRAREIVDVLEARLMRAVEERRLVDVSAHTDLKGAAMVLIVIGGSVDRELSGSEATQAVSEAFERMMKQRGGGL